MISIKVFLSGLKPEFSRTFFTLPMMASDWEAGKSLNPAVAFNVMGVFDQYRSGIRPLAALMSSSNESLAF
jgi:hypothetical protein